MTSIATSYRLLSWQLLPWCDAYYRDEHYYLDPIGLLSRRASDYYREKQSTYYYRNDKHQLLLQRAILSRSRLLTIATSTWLLSRQAKYRLYYCGEHQLVLSINIATTTTAMSNIILSRSHRLLSRRPSITIDYYCDKQYYRDRIATTIATSIWLIDQDEKFHSLLAVQKKHPDCIDFCPNER
jgi:hypothetical protein